MNSRTTFNSYPNAFKSMYYIERAHWDADVKVDIDHHRNPLRIRNIREAAAWLKKRKYMVTKVMVMRTARGIHIRVWIFGGIAGFDGLPPRTVLRIQRLMGDDPVRQRFNARRVARKEPGWNVLWNEKWRNGRLVSHEVIDNELTQKVARMLQWANRSE